MLSFLPAPIVGVIALLLYALNILYAATVVFSLALLKLIPIKPWQKMLNHLIMFMPIVWIHNSDTIKRFTSKTEFDIRLPASLSMNEFYLVISNHQSWSDIVMLYSVFNQRIPMLKFFWKKELRFVPLVGMLCTLYGFPVMYRHTKEQLKKHPEWKGRDFENTKKACDKLREFPGSLTVFAEGTRFTSPKHARQQSPYQHLLKPKAGGIALGLQCLGDKVNTLLDVTIIYPPKEKSFWRFCCGKAKKITVNVRAIPLTPEIRGDYQNDSQYRARFQQFVNKVWADKDAHLYKEMNSA